MSTPSRDEFEAWRADPVTEFVLTGLQRLSEAQEIAFTAAAWGGPDSREGWDELRVTRARCKARAEAYSDLAGLTIDDAYGANGLEPIPPSKEEAA